VRTLVNEGRDSSELTHAAKIEGMETLREAAIRKLAEGATTFEEVARVTGDVG
jgi:general secretion pathway protein E